MVKGFFKVKGIYIERFAAQTVRLDKALVYFEFRYVCLFVLFDDDFMCVVLFCSAPSLAGFTTDQRGRWVWVVDQGIRPSPGCRQKHDLRTEHRKLHRLYQGVQGDEAEGGNAQHAPVHEWHEELLGQARRKRVREGS